jgi:hypothetical protein
MLLTFLNGAWAGSLSKKRLGKATAINSTSIPKAAIGFVLPRKSGEPIAQIPHTQNACTLGLENAERTISNMNRITATAAVL